MVNGRSSARKSVFLFFVPKSFFATSAEDLLDSVKMLIF